MGQEFDASVLGAHTVPAQSASIPGINVVLTKVANGGAGQTPTVTFTVKDNKGNGIPMSTFSANSGSFSLVMAGPTSDYGYTSFGADVTTTPGYVTESVLTAATCGSDGTCTYTFTHAVPAKATGTYAIGAEARMNFTLTEGSAGPQTRGIQRSEPGNLFLGGRNPGAAAPHGGGAGQLQQLPLPVWSCMAACATILHTA